MKNIFKNITNNIFPKKDTKLFDFFEQARYVGAIKSDIPANKIGKIDRKKLLGFSYSFLAKERVVTIKEEKKIIKFQEQYNNYIEYCINNKFLDNSSYKKVDKLNLITVPDMSSIDIPDISKELKEIDIDIDAITQIFSKIKI